MPLFLPANICTAYTLEGFYEPPLSGQRQKQPNRFGRNVYRSSRGLRRDSSLRLSRTRIRIIISTGLLRRDQPRLYFKVVVSRQWWESHGCKHVRKKSSMEFTMTVDCLVHLFFSSTTSLLVPCIRMCLHVYITVSILHTWMQIYTRSPSRYRLFSRNSGVFTAKSLNDNNTLMCMYYFWIDRYLLSRYFWTSFL